MRDQLRGRERWPLGESSTRCLSDKNRDGTSRRRDLAGIRRRLRGFGTHVSTEIQTERSVMQRYAHSVTRLSVSRPANAFTSAPRTWLRRVSSPSISSTNCHKVAGSRRRIALGYTRISDLRHRQARKPMRERERKRQNSARVGHACPFHSDRCDYGFPVGVLRACLTCANKGNRRAFFDHALSGGAYFVPAGNPGSL